jgi:hypothetical protein
MDIRAFRKDGYIYPAGFLDSDKIKQLYFDHLIEFSKSESRRSTTALTHYKLIDPSVNPHFYCLEIWNTIFNTSITEDVLKLLGEDAVCISSTLVAKPPKSNIYVTPHQDRLYWGLKKAKGLSVWLAITDSNINNGCIRIIKGTHRKLYRHNYIQDEKNLTPLGEHIPLELFKNHEEIVLNLKKGEYSIHDCNIVHYSLKNESDSWRIGLVMRFTNLSALKETYINARNYRSLKKETNITSNWSQPDRNFNYTRSELLRLSKPTRDYYRQLTNEHIELQK